MYKKMKRWTTRRGKIEDRKTRKWKKYETIKELFLISFCNDIINCNWDGKCYLWFDYRGFLCEFIWCLFTFRWNKFEKLFIISYEAFLYDGIILCNVMGVPYICLWNFKVFIPCLPLFAVKPYKELCVIDYDWISLWLLRFNNENYITQ